MNLDLGRLRASLLTEPATGQPVREAGMEFAELTPAAVLFPIVQRGSGQTVLMTQRTAHLRDHAGQISFPGGRVEDDDPSPVATALRETEEEIGLARKHVEILGFLPEYHTGTGFRVTPVVALLTPPFDLSPIRSKWRKCSKCRLPSCSIRQITSAIRCTTVAPCATFSRCPTATISSGAPPPE